MEPVHLSHVSETSKCASKCAETMPLVTLLLLGTSNSIAISI